MLACGRRWGKTTAALIAACEAVLRGEAVWWILPTVEASDQVWRTLKTVLAPVTTNKLERGRRIEAWTGGTIAVKSGEAEASLRGVGLDLVIVDEAALIDEEIWTAALRPTLSDTKGKALMLSTPRGHNWFYEQYTRGLGDWHGYQSWQLPTSSSPTVDAEEIEFARAELPDSRFRQEYLAEFVADGGAVFRKVDEAVYTGEVTAFGTVYVGADLAQSKDFTVYTAIDDRGTVLDVDRFNNVDWSTQRARLAAFMERHQAATAVIELNSVGQPFIEALHESGLHNVTGFTTTNESKNALIRALTLAFEQESIRIPKHAVLLNELKAYGMTRLPSGRWRYEGKPHDDTVMSLALAWRAMQDGGVRLPVLDVATPSRWSSVAPVYSGGESKWRRF